MPIEKNYVKSFAHRKLCFGCFLGLFHEIGCCIGDEGVELEVLLGYQHGQQIYF